MKDFIGVFFIIISAIAITLTLVFIGLTLSFLEIFLIATGLSVVMIILFIRLFPKRGIKKKESED